MSIVGGTLQTNTPDRKHSPMNEVKDLSPARNGVQFPTLTGGRPARPSNAMLMRHIRKPERFAAGREVYLDKISSAILDAQIKLAERQIYAARGLQRAKLAAEVVLQKLAEDVQQLLTGGLADDRSPSDFDGEQLNKGISVEKEHTRDSDIAREIAMDHLAEDPLYYDHLAEMEEEHQEGGIPQNEILKFAGEEREPQVDNHQSAPSDKMRPRAEMVLFTSKGVYMIDKGDYLLMPGGGVDDGEQPRDACIRETIEESNRHPINVMNAGITESIWPEDSGNDFWDTSEFDGERTYFFTGVDAGDAGVTHADLEDFQVVPFAKVIARLEELISDEGQGWAKRNNEERLRLVKDAKRSAKLKSNLKPIKQAQAAIPQLPQPFTAPQPQSAEQSPTPVTPSQAPQQVTLPTDMARQQGDPDVWAKDFVSNLAAGGQPPAAAATGAAGSAPTGPTAPMKTAKVADAAAFKPMQQHLMFTPDGHIVARRLRDRRFAFPTEGSGKPAPYESDILFAPEGGVPDEGYHGYKIGLRVGDADQEIPEGFEAVNPNEALKDLYASMGLSVNKPYRQLDRARARAMVRFLKRRRQQSEAATSVA